MTFLPLTFQSDGGWSLGEILEESPDTIRRHTVYNTREAGMKIPADGKCHRKQTTCAQYFARNVGRR